MARVAGRPNREEGAVPIGAPRRESVGIVGQPRDRVVRRESRPALALRRSCRYPPQKENTMAYAIALYGFNAAVWIHNLVAVVS